MTARTMNTITAALFLALFLLLNAFSSLLYDADFYHQQYELNGAYRTFGQENVLNATESLFSYLKDEGQLSDFYNEKEKAHMDDVKALIDGASSLRWMFLGFSVLLIFFLYFKAPDQAFLSLAQVFILTAVFIVVIFLLGLLVSSSFRPVFLSLHEHLFTNNLWQLDPATDNMIHLFPESFFQAFFSKVMLHFFTGGLSLGLLGGGVLYLVKKGKLR
ncbi:MAG: DUF1461 domain-containing protein [DPANN group archaeon]|nr:DUF1461 domain-containing protein [DPANN group archaeon]